MKKKDDKTDNLKRKAQHAIFPKNRCDYSSRRRLLLRLGSAALALTLAIGGVSLLRRSVDVQLPVVHAMDNDWSDGEINAYAGEIMTINKELLIQRNSPDGIEKMKKINCYSGGQGEDEYGGIITIDKGVTVNMVRKMDPNDRWEADTSQIDLDTNCTLNLKGKMTGEFKTLRIRVEDNSGIIRYKAAHFNIFLNEGAVFTAEFEEYKNDSSAGDFTCYGCNYGCNAEGGSVAATYVDSADNTVKPINNGTSDNPTNATIGYFNKTDSGPVYTVTATPKEGYSQVVWTKGPKGSVITTDTGDDPQVVVNGNIVDIRLKENARYPVYATFIHDPVWTWNDDNEATVTIYTYVPDNENSDEEGILTQTYDATETAAVTAPTCTKDGYTTYRASVEVNGQTYSTTDDDIRVVTNTGTALGHDLSEWEVIHEPTQTETGTKTRHCQREGCDYYEEDVIPALGADEGGENGGENGGEGHSNAYHWIEADSVWTWTKGSSSDMPVKLKSKNAAEDSQTFYKLRKVSVDGTVIYETDGVSEETDEISVAGKFKATPGSIKFVFHPDYLKTLTKGEHTLKVELTDGMLEHTFTIAESGGSDDSGNSSNTGTDKNNTDNSKDTGKGDWSPETADNNFRLFLAGWFFAASAGIIVMLLLRKKRYSNR